MALHSTNHQEEHDDDVPVGRILGRRDVLAFFGGTAGAALLAACQPVVLSEIISTPTLGPEGEIAAATATAAPA